jgi:hypothetical protein
MGFIVGGSNGFTIIETQAVSTSVYDPVVRGNQEFDGHLFYEIIPDIYSLLADYETLPRMWEGYVEAMNDLLLNLICVDSARSILDVPLDYQRKYQHIDFLFSDEFVNDPTPIYYGKGSDQMAYSTSEQALDCSWKVKLSTDAAARALRSKFDERGTTRWSWRAKYTQMDVGAYGFVGFFNKDSVALANTLAIGIGNGGRVAILQVSGGGGVNMKESGLTIPLNKELQISATYLYRTRVVEVEVLNVEDSLPVASLSFNLQDGMSDSTFLVNCFGTLNLDYRTSFSAYPLFVPVSEKQVKGLVYAWDYLDPSVEMNYQAVPALQDKWHSADLFWTEGVDYHFYEDPFFSFRAQPPDFLLAEYVSYNLELIRKNFGEDVGFVGSNTATYKSQVQALHSVYWKGPTKKSLVLGTQALLGLPFAEEAGTVTVVNPLFTGDLGEIVIRGKNGLRAYQYPNGINPKVVVGDVVEKFDVLTEGVELRDWKSHPNWFKPFLGADPVPSTDPFAQALNILDNPTTPVSELMKYHTFMICVDKKVYVDYTLPNLLIFFQAIKQTWKTIIFNLFHNLTDDVPIDDGNLGLEGVVRFHDHCCSSLVVNPHYGDPTGHPPYAYQYGMAPPIQYGTYWAHFPLNPIHVVLTNVDVVSHTTMFLGIPTTISAGDSAEGDIP